jgi:hypothetical protein
MFIAGVRRNYPYYEIGWESPTGGWSFYTFLTTIQGVRVQGTLAGVYLRLIRNPTQV